MFCLLPGRITAQKYARDPSKWYKELFSRTSYYNYKFEVSVLPF